ncbi:hypothetical protein BpHYR1_013932, partial [Brachionus plicatilis]
RLIEEDLLKRIKPHRQVDTVFKVKLYNGKCRITSTYFRQKRLRPKKNWILEEKLTFSDTFNTNLLFQCSQLSAKQRIISPKTNSRLIALYNDLVCEYLLIPTAIAEGFIVLGLHQSNTERTYLFPHLSF